MKYIYHVFLLESTCPTTNTLPTYQKKTAPSATPSHHLKCEEPKFGSSHTTEPRGRPFNVYKGVPKKTKKLGGIRFLFYHTRIVPLHCPVTPFPQKYDHVFGVFLDVGKRDTQTLPKRVNVSSRRRIAPQSSSLSESITCPVRLVPTTVPTSQPASDGGQWQASSTSKI